MIDNPSNYLPPAVAVVQPANVASSAGARPIHLLFGLTREDESWLAQNVPKPVIDDLRILLGHMAEIQRSPLGVNKACALIASRMQRRGFAAESLRRKFYDYTSRGRTVGDVHYAPGDWRVLLDWAKAPDKSEVGLPPEFLAKFWRRLCDRNQRVLSQAYRELITIWRTGYDPITREQIKQIDGYAEWPKVDPRFGHPFGWSATNLMRYVPDGFERTAARHGIAAASALGLRSRYSRRGLALGERVQFDDHDFDVKVNFPGQLKSYRPQCFAAVDELTACCLNMVTKPTFWDEDEQSMRVLNETDAMWFFTTHFMTFGYRPEGTTMLIEHGRTAIRGNKSLPINSPLRDDLEKRFFDLSGGAIRAERGGRFHHKAHGGQFAPPSGGNPRHKPIVECFWRLMNDRLASLPGQVGLDRNHAPESMEREDAYINGLLKSAATMDPEQAARLILRRLTYPEFCEFAWMAKDAINTELKHDLRNWVKCGFVLHEWRPDLQSPWQPVALLGDSIKQLPEGEQQHALARIRSDDRLYRTRQMSRFEAMQSLQARGGLVKFEPHVIPQLVGIQHALRKGDPLTVSGGVLEFEDWRVSPDPLVYLALKPDGNRLREGEKFVCFVNPMLPDRLLACDAKLRVIAVCDLMPEPSSNDERGVMASLGLKQAWYHRALKDMRERNAPDADGLKFMRAHNEAVRNGSTATRAEVAQREKDSDLAEEALMRNVLKPQ